MSFILVPCVSGVAPTSPMGALLASAITSKSFSNPALIHPILAMAKHIRYYDSEELGMAVIPKFLIDASLSFVKLGKIVGSLQAEETNHGIHGGPIHHVFPTEHAVASTSSKSSVSDHKAAVDAHYKHGKHYHYHP